MWCIVGLLTGLITGLIISPVFGLSSGLIFGITIGLVYGIVESGIQRSKIGLKVRVNQGVQGSFKSGFFGSLILGPLTGTLLWFVLSWFVIEKYSISLGWFIFFQILGLFMGFLVYGGISALQHYSLRLALILTKKTPINYVAFLNYAVHLIFLQRIGGGYIFIHRLLLEHFAERGNRQNQGLRD